MKRFALLFAAVLCASFAGAGDAGLRAVAPQRDERIGFNLRIPVALVNAKLKQALSNRQRVKIVNPDQPIITVRGGKIHGGNVMVNAAAVIDLHPEAILSVAFLGEDSISFKIEEVAYNHLFASPVIGMLKFVGIFDENGLVKELIRQFTENLSAGLAKNSHFRDENNVPKSPLDFTYDEASRTVTVTAAEGFFSPLLPRLHLKDAAMNETYIDISAGSIDSQEPGDGCNFYVSEGFINKLLSMANGRYITFEPGRDPGGILLGYPNEGEFSISATLNTDWTFPWPYRGKKLSVAFSVKVRPVLLSENTVSLYIDELDLNGVYAGGERLPNIPDWILHSPKIRGLIIDRATQAFSQCCLKKYVKMEKKAADRVDVYLRSGIFLPAFSDLITLQSLRAKRGKLLLNYSLHLK